MTPKAFLELACQHGDKKGFTFLKNDFRVTSFAKQSKTFKQNSSTFVDDFLF